MDIKYFGDNFVPGLNVKNINAGVINPLMNAGAAVSQAYGEYGKNLRQALEKEPDDFSQQFLAGKISDKKKSESGGNITRVGGKEYRMDNPADVKALNAVLAADKASRPGQQFADLRGGGGMTTQTPPVGPVGPPSPSADPRNADYLTARGKLTKDSTADDIKKVEDIGMTAWAKANPKLAAKVKPGQSGYELIQNMKGQGTEAYDKTDTFKPSDIPEADRQNPVDQATALGITDLKDAQVFKDNAMITLLGNYGNENIKPIVEGITLPTTTDYAGAFNQTDVPDLQSMLNMGDKLEKFGYGDLDINPQKFMSSFRGNVIDTSKSPETSGIGNTVDLPEVNNLLATLGADEYFKRLDAGLLTGK